MLNVCCVCVGTAYSPEYVAILHSMVRRNLEGGLRGRFTVFTDNPSLFEKMPGVQTKLVPSELTGWWAKLYLFSDNAFPKGERVLYFDLDTVITGPLDDIAAYRGEFAILRDAYRSNGWQSSVMAWEAGKLSDLWRGYVNAGYPQIDGGDQAWIEQFQPTADIWQSLYPGKFRSYKVDCKEFVPKGTSVVFFHGFPRPHQAGGWVKDAWKVQDGAFTFALNVKEDRIRTNIKHALSKPKWIEMRDGTQYPAIIVGGGPSLEHDLWRIRGHQLSGGLVYATNNTYRYLKENGITPDAHVMHDARAENLAFVPTEDTKCYYASQCHPDVLDAAGDRLICWHPHSELALEVIGDSPKGKTMVSGGSTIGLNAMSLAYILGHRTLLLFGFDSSYADGEGHAYAQSLNEGEWVVEVETAGQTFRCAPWMVQQSEQFLPLANQLMALGCHVAVYGTGLLPTLAAHTEPAPTAADLRAKSLFHWLGGRENPIGAEIGVFAGELSRRLLSRTDLTLYLVDSWATHHSDVYAASGDFHASLTPDRQEHFYRLTQQMVRFAGSRAKVVRETSVEAAKAIPDGSLDFVFIDADHSYEGCRADILAWSPKIKKGGFISGHDYENPDFPAWGVKQAVTELLGTPELGDNFTWKVNII
jgi:uncharacterized Rossmann fold enzyme